MPLHPFLVHFVIAFFTVSLLFELLALKTGNKTHQTLGYLLLIIAAVSVIPAVISGLIEKSKITIPAEANVVFNWHETTAFITASIILFLSLWRIALKNQLTRKLKFIYLTVAFTGLISLYIGAYHGGLLVYRHGIGIRSQRISPAEPASFQPEMKKSRENSLFYPPEDSLK